jgi:hypothetical protein
MTSSIIALRPRRLQFRYRCRQIFNYSFLLNSPASSCVFWIGEGEQVIVGIVAILGDECVGVFAGVVAVK